MARLNWSREASRKRAEQHDALQTGRDYLREHKPLTEKQRVFIKALRAELGDLSIALPATCHEGRALIDELLARKEKRA